MLIPLTTARRRRSRCARQVSRSTSSTQTATASQSTRRGRAGTRRRRPRSRAATPDCASRLASPWMARATSTLPTHATSITVYAAGASGNATPTATIAGGNTGLGVPYGIALDGAGNIYVANAGGNSITVYAAGASGNATPTATIAGGNTGLCVPIGIALDGAGKIYVANNDCGSQHITVFAAGRAGTRPRRPRSLATTLDCKARLASPWMARATSTLPTGAPAMLPAASRSMRRGRAGMQSQGPRSRAAIPD